MVKELKMVKNEFGEFFVGEKGILWILDKERIKNFIDEENFIKILEVISGEREINDEIIDIVDLGCGDSGIMFVLIDKYMIENIDDFDFEFLIDIYGIEEFDKKNNEIKRVLKDLWENK